VLAPKHPASKLQGLITPLLTLCNLKPGVDHDCECGRQPSVLHQRGILID
jgi:hypothetical protein